jgi:hypothetical protein
MAVLTGKRRKRVDPKMLDRQGTIKWLISHGLLFEINRTIMHPLGRSLQIQRNGDGSYDLAMIADNPGVTFDEATFRAGAAKYAVFLTEEGNAALHERAELLGFRVQLQPNAKEQRRK